MNRTRLVFIGLLALALGAFASALAYHSLQQRNGMSGGSLQEVLVAAADIPVGTKVQAKDIRVVHLPVEALPPGGFRHTEKVIGRGAILPIAQGEFFISGKNLASENAGSGLPSMIPSGMRAVSVRVNDSSVGVFVQPGTRVDVLMTGNPGSGEAQTFTVLKNVLVLANGAALDRNSTRTESQNSPVITLLVSPDDAEKLALAMAQGRIQLALRNPLDTSQSDVAAVNVRSLFPGQKSAAPAPVQRVRTKPAPAVQTPVAPSPYGVEVIKGDKRDVTKVED